jgi:hypothetical protein
MGVCPGLYTAVEARYPAASPLASEIPSPLALNEPYIVTSCRN